MAVDVDRTSGELRERLARAERLAEERARQVELVAAVGHALVGAGSFAEQVRRAVDAVARALEAAGAGVWLLDAGRRSLVDVVVLGHVDAGPVALADGGVVARALASHGGLVERAAGGDAGDDALRVAAFPLIVDGVPAGVFAVVADAAAVAAAGDILRTVVDQIALALANRHAAAEGERLSGLVADGLVREAEQKRAEEASLRALAADLERRVGERTRALEEANRELEAFSYSVSHDLRAPIRHISGFAEMLDRHGRAHLDTRARHYLDTIQSAAHQAGQLIDDLLAFARVGRTDFVHERVDLTELFAGARREIVAESGASAVAWSIDPLPVVNGDRAMLRVVAKNLLSNAVKYSRGRERPAISVGARVGSGEISVWVRDNGVGFDQKHVDKLFGVFQRLHRSDEFEGSGIGLASVRRIVERHGGRTFAEGAPDAGATFTFTLPAPDFVSP